MKGKIVSLKQQPKLELNLICFSKLKYPNRKTYFRLLLLLSGDISLCPGPINGSQKHNNDHCAVFKKRGLHFVHHQSSAKNR